MSSLRVALIYPPPWKIPADGESRDPVDGAPSDYQPGDLDSDFFQIPYGLLSLAVQARRAGHAVKVLNLSAHSWSSVEQTILQLKADVVGMSCWTANRRGVRLVADCIKRHHPKTHVTVGGPHATPLPRQVLEHYAAVDSVIVGEGEVTFLELLERLGGDRAIEGLAGAYTRDSHHHVIGGATRTSVETLDSLASPHAAFPTHILMTSRGCPWACTFCGAEASWGRGFRPFGVERVLDDIEQALSRTKVRMLLIKDDTFTTNKTRVLELCRKIHERKLNFLWSCDTRVDVLSEELVREMRLAGCERMSLGVESGSSKILKAINKKITVEQIERSAELLRRYGIKARFYMMLGNRGETAETFAETLSFLERARPHQYIFSCLSIYPGTHDFDEAVTRGWLDAEAYFTGNFQELKIPFDASDEVAAMLSDWFANHRGLRNVYVPDVAALRGVCAALGQPHAPALVELAEALIETGELDEAEHLLAEAESLGYALMGLIYNARACIANLRGDFGAMKEALVTAAKLDPQHYILLRNATAAQQWLTSGGPQTNVPLKLLVRHDFQLFERTEQPTLPGALPEHWENWDLPSAVTLLPESGDPGSKGRIPLDRPQSPSGTSNRRLQTIR